MATSRDEVLPAGARHCFACGEDNPNGLHLTDIRLDEKGDRVIATLLLRPEFQSYPGVLHGGIAATALDEVMGYATKLLTGQWAVTANMQVRYREPVPCDGEAKLFAGVDGEGGRRRVRVWSTLVLDDGKVAVEANALLVALPPEVRAEFEAAYPQK